ncbi:MAG: hypothetical protein H0W72_05890 [Planctomycetes bacterium]|nr:hypothetical protein [Planctomycetota bacterium]
MRVVLCVLLVLPWWVANAAAEPEYDWAEHPESALPGEIAELGVRLQPLLAGKRCLVAPFVGTRHHLNTWAFETVAEFVFRDELARRGVTVVDDAPLLARFEPQVFGLPPTIPYSTTVITELAAACGADLVILGGCQILSESTVTVYLHDGRTGKRLAKDEVALDAEDVSIPGNTRAPSRALLDWVEARLGTTVGDGSSAELVQTAVSAITGVRAMDLSRSLPPRQIPLPGDLIRCEGAVIVDDPITIDGVVYRVHGPGRITILEQSAGDKDDAKGRIRTLRLDLSQLGPLVQIGYRRVPWCVLAASPEPAAASADPAQR